MLIDTFKQNIRKFFLTMRAVTKSISEQTKHVLRAYKLSTAKYLSKKGHVHNEYLKKGEAAQKANRLLNQTDELSAKIHSHKEYFPVKEVKIIDSKPVVILDKSIFLNNVMYLNFADKKHYHVDYLPKQHIYNRLYAMTAARLSDNRTPSKYNHEHDEYVSKEESVNYTQALSDSMRLKNTPDQFSPKEHYHEQLNIYPHIYSKFQGKDKTITINSKQLVLIYSSYTGISQTKPITIRLPLLDELKWLPDDMLARQLVLTKNVRFYTFFWDALAQFNSSLSSSSPFTIYYYQRKNNQDWFQELLSAFMLISYSNSNYNFNSIFVFNEHLSRFCNITKTTVYNKKWQVSNNAIVWGTEISTSTLTSYFDNMQKHLSAVESYYRLFFDIDPGEEMNYPLSGLFSVGGLVSHKDGNNTKLEFFNGGFPFSALLFVKEE